VPPSRQSTVEYWDWETKFLPKFKEMWKPGDHLTVIAPTGAGKTTLVGGLLSLRRYALVLDPKGGDETLGGLKLPRLDSWPGEQKLSRMVADNNEKGRPSRYVVGPIVHRGTDLPKLVQALADALDGAFDMGGWTVYVDELQVLADRRLMNLSGKAAKLLVAARSKGVTFVSSFQAPSWVPSESIRQPTWIAVSYTRDTDTVNRLAEVLGRPKPEIRGALKGLDPFCWLIIGRDPRAPIIITKPPRIAAVRRSA
jgi:hypothetical protein